MFLKGKTFVPEWTRGAVGLGDNLEHFPHMAGKAALLKDLVDFVEAEVQLYWIAWPEDTQVCHILRCCWGIAEYGRLTRRGGEVLEETKASAVVAAGKAFLQSFSWLADHAKASGMQRWKVRPKMHMFAHQLMMVEMTGWNPKAWSCWMDEDFMGRLKKVVTRTRSRSMSTVSSSLTRYIWCFFVWSCLITAAAVIVTVSIAVKYCCHCHCHSVHCCRCCCFLLLQPPCQALGGDLARVAREAWREPSATAEAEASV